MVRNFILSWILYAGLLGATCAQEPSLQVLRDEILFNDFDGPQILRFYEMTHNVSDPEAVIMAYQAVSEAFMARLGWNPYDKILYLKKSEELFLDALKKEPDNLEIRFLRFSTQAGIPGFLGFSREMTADKDFIIQRLDHLNDKELDDKLFNFIVDFISSSRHCTAQDLASLEKSRKKRFG